MSETVALCVFAGLLALGSPPAPSVPVFDGAEVATDPLGRAFALLKAGRARDAEAAFRELLAADPRDGRAHLGLGLALAAQERLADALRELEQAARSLPDSADA